MVFFEGVIANICKYCYSFLSIFKDETAKVLLALSIYMFVFMTNEHLAANFASFSLLSFNSVSSQLPHLNFLIFTSLWYNSSLPTRRRES